MLSEVLSRRGEHAPGSLPLAAAVRDDSGDDRRGCAPPVFNLSRSRQTLSGVHTLLQTILI